jgi:hypothetical protein
MQIVKQDFGAQFDQADRYGSFEPARDQERHKDRVQRAGNPPRDGLDQASVWLFDHITLPVSSARRDLERLGRDCRGRLASPANLPEPRRPASWALKLAGWASLTQISVNCRASIRFLLLRTCTMRQQYQETTKCQ